MVAVALAERSCVNVNVYVWQARNFKASVEFDEAIEAKEKES